MREIWKEIPNYPEYYASNLGRIKSLKRTNPIIMKPGKHRDGYYQLSIRKDNKEQKLLIHRLIAITFLPNPGNKETVNHKDSNRCNNRVGNLEWCTKLENMQHAARNNRMSNRIGEINPKTKLNIEEVDEIRKRLDGNFTLREIAEEFKVTTGCIASIKSGRSWSHHGK